MRYLVSLGEGNDEDQDPTVAIGDPYVDVVYGPLVGAMALLVLRYLHASLPLRTDPVCTAEELAAATASKPRRMAGPIRRLARHRLIVVRRPGPPARLPASGPPAEDDPSTLILPPRLPLASMRAVERLPPLARRVALEYLDR